MNLRLTDETGRKFTWRVFRDARKPATWNMVDHNGYQRVIGDTWLESVPRVRLIVENFGLKLAQELS